MNAICLHPERALARKQALALAQIQTVSAPPIMGLKRIQTAGKGRKSPTPSLSSFSSSPSRSPSPAPRRVPRYGYKDEFSESSGSENGGDDVGSGGGGVLDEDEEDEELDKVRGRVSIGQESMSSDDVLDLFAYDDSV